MLNASHVAQRRKAIINSMAATWLGNQVVISCDMTSSPFKPSNAPFQRSAATAGLKPLRDRLYAGFGETLAEAHSAGRLQSPPARRSFTKETDGPRVPPGRVSSKIIARSAKSKTVNTLVRARQRQARAAIWSLIPRDFSTGSKARSRRLTPIRTLRSGVGWGWSGDIFSQEASHVSPTSDPSSI